MCYNTCYRLYLMIMTHCPLITSPRFAEWMSGDLMLNEDADREPDFVLLDMRSDGTFQTIAETAHTLHPNGTVTVVSFMLSMFAFYNYNNGKYVPINTDNCIGYFVNKHIY